ncbi:MAG: 16S rRNA (guanine(527)-N(7))-methyltransferase RsmG [Caulobacteraceae bacterium]
MPGGFLEAIGASAERRADVEAYSTLLARANARMNLVGASTLGDFWRRHFIDSAQLAWFAPEGRVWADLGSGAGLPGIVLAILMKGRRGGRVHLIESVAKRARFLGRVIEALDLPATLHHARAEELRLSVEVVTARACAPLTRLLGFAQPYMARGARGLFLKGQEAEAEIAAARAAWRFDVEILGSLSDPRGRVLAVSGLARAGRA